MNSMHVCKGMFASGESSEIFCVGALLEAIGCTQEARAGDT